MDTASDYKSLEEYVKKEKREKKLKELENQPRVPKTAETDFHHRGLNQLREMIKNSNPEAVETAGEHWRAAADRLAGEDGQGGIRKQFKDAIEHALAHWQGPASERFLEEANRVLDKIDKSYSHARNAERALIGPRGAPDSGTAANLRKAKERMSQIKDPGFFDKAGDLLGDDRRDDSQLKKDLANPKLDTKTALELNRDSLTESKERHLEAVAVMEALAVHYQGQRRVLRTPVDGHNNDDWPPPPSDAPSPAPVALPVQAPPRSPSPIGLTPSGTVSPSPAQNPKPVLPPRDAGIVGGAPKPVTPSSPQIGTSVDGFPGVTGGTAAGGVGGGGSLPGGAVGGVSGGASGGVTGAPGVPGMPGGLGAGAARQGASGGRAGATGRPGMGGMGGGAGAGAAGRGGVSGGTGRGGGSLARKSGGVVGAPKGATGAGAAQGGSGLHRSRGGTQSGQAGIRGTGPMAGVPGARGGRSEEEQRREGERPDYLVEDEETWTLQRNVAPRVIE